MWKFYVEGLQSEVGKLMDLVNSSNPEISIKDRKEALKKLGKIAEDILETRVAVEAGVIPLLVKFIESPNPEIRIEAISALSQYVITPEFAKLAIEADVIPMLVRTLKSPDSNAEFTFNTMRALKFIIENSSNGREIAIASGFPPLKLDILANLPINNNQRVTAKEFVEEIFEKLFEEFEKFKSSNGAPESCQLSPEQFLKAFENLSDIEQMTLDFSKLSSENNEQNQELKIFGAFLQKRISPLHRIIGPTILPCHSTPDIENMIQAGAIPECIKILSNPDYNNIKDFAAQTLLIISTGSAKHKQAIANANGIPTLIKTLSSDDVVLRCLAAHTLGNINHESTSQLTSKINAEKSVTPLLKLLESSNTEMVLRITEAIGFVVKKVDFESKVVSALMKLLASKHDLIRYSSACTLCKLTENFVVEQRLQILTPVIPVLIEAMQFNHSHFYLKSFITLSKKIWDVKNADNELIIVANGIPAIIKFLSSKFPPLKHIAAETITKICCKRNDGGKEVPSVKNIEAVLLAGAVPFFIEFLNSSEQYLHKISLKALQIINGSEIKHNQEIIEAGVIPALVKLLDSTNLDIRFEAISALLQYMNTTETVKLAIEADAIPKLVKNFNLPDNADQFTFNTMRALKFIIENSSNGREIAIQSGAPLITKAIIEVLVKTMESDDVGLQRTAFLTMYKIAAEKKNEYNEFIIATNGLKPLVKFLNFGNEEISRATVRIIETICYEKADDDSSKISPKNIEAISAAGIVPVLIKLLNSPVFHLQRFAFEMIEEISKAPPEQKQIIFDSNGMNGIPVLKMILQVTSKEITLATDSESKKRALDPVIDIMLFSSNVANIFQNLAKASSTKQKQAIIDAGSIPIFVKLLSQKSILDDEEDVLLSAISVICDISAGDEKQSIISEVDALPSIIKLLKYPNNHIRILTLITIQNLSIYIPDEALIKHEIISILIKLTESKNNQILEHAVAALCNFSWGTNQHRQFIIDANVIDVAKKLLNSSNITVCRQTAQLLVNLSKGTKEQLQRVLDAGIVAALEQRLQSSDGQMHEDCRRALNSALKKICAAQKNHV